MSVFGRHANSIRELKRIQNDKLSWSHMNVSARETKFHNLYPFIVSMGIWPTSNMNSILTLSWSWYFPVALMYTMWCFCSSSHWAGCGKRDLEVVLGCQADLLAGIFGWAQILRDCRFVPQIEPDPSEHTAHRRFHQKTITWVPIRVLFGLNALIWDL